jgi:hypothetical protein
MSDYGDASRAASHGHASSPISVPWVVLAAVLMAIGVFALWYGLTLFDWIFFLGIVPSVVGGLMLFDPRAGANRA